MPGESGERGWHPGWKPLACLCADLHSALECARQQHVGKWSQQRPWMCQLPG